MGRTRWVCWKPRQTSCCLLAGVTRSPCSGLARCSIVISSFAHSETLNTRSAVNSSKPIIDVQTADCIKRI